LPRFSNEKTPIPAAAADLGAHPGGTLHLLTRESGGSPKGRGSLPAGGAEADI